MSQTTTSKATPAHPHLWRRILGIIGLVLLVLLGIFLLLGALPVSQAGLDSAPAPETSYAAALERYAAATASETGTVNEASRSQLLVHGDRTPRAYVLVHGTTNSPLQWQELGQTLYDRGHNVLILRMPYHGLVSRQVGELRRLTAQDLRVYADEAADIGAGLGDEVVVVGISGGGAVAAWLAQNRPEVDRALLLAPFFGIRGVPAFANTLLMNAFSRLPNVSFDSPKEPQHDWVYRGEASRGVVAFLALGHRVLAQARAAAPGAEVAIITTTVDNTANNTATATLIDRWRQAGATVTTFEFGPEQDIPHNSVDPAADPAKKQQVYDQILTMLGE